MLKICSAKCVDRTYREADLSKGEAVCLDRCSAKFFEAHQTISEQLQKEGAARGFGM
jgi:import inner membrane translocase subunit TIM10